MTFLPVNSIAQSINSSVQESTSIVEPNTQSESVEVDTTTALPGNTDSSVIDGHFVDENIEILEEVVETPQAPPTNKENLHVFPKSATLEQIEFIIENSALELAYAIIVDLRAQYEQQENWLDWEVLFFDIATQLEDWSDILERSAEIDKYVPFEFYLKLQDYTANAEIKLGKFEEARNRLRKLIWNYRHDQNNVIKWRGLVTQTYFSEGLFEDAKLSLITFDQDYRPSNSDWAHRYSRLLIQTGDEVDALKRVAALQTKEGRLLNLFLQLSSGTATPNDTVRAAVDLEKEFVDRHLKQEVWGIVKLAAEKMNDWELVVTAHEKSLSLVIDSNKNGNRLPVVPISTVEDFLSANYLYAIYVGNEFNLIIGDYENWFQLAQEYDITSPLTARAIYLFVATNVSDEHLRHASVAALADNLYAAGLERILELIFIDSRKLELSGVAPQIQNLLLKRSLYQRKYDVSSFVMGQMDKPQESEESLNWLTRRARIEITLENWEDSAEFLEQAISELPEDNVLPESIDRITQVLFDFQEFERNEEAIVLFEQLYTRTTTVQQRREILRWVSDSYSALQDHKKSSEYLLLSAAMEKKWNDNWGQSARLKAADELAQAGLINDARMIYEALRDDTLDPRRKAIVSDRLNKLTIIH